MRDHRLTRMAASRRALALRLLLLRGAAVLVLANKQDLPNAMRADVISEQTGLRSLRGHDWYIQPCSAQTGEGILEGLEWLHSSLNGKTTKEKARMSRAG